MFFPDNYARRTEKPHEEAPASSNACDGCRPRRSANRAPTSKSPRQPPRYFAGFARTRRIGAVASTERVYCAPPTNCSYVIGASGLDPPSP
jgi:hypothetical protein